MRIAERLCAVCLLLLLGACYGSNARYAGPGCLAYLYPSTAGFAPMPVRGGTSEFAPEWQERVVAVRVIYGTFRLYSERDYHGFIGDYQAPSEMYLTPSKKIGSVLCTSPEPPPPPPQPGT